MSGPRPHQGTSPVSLTPANVTSVFLTPANVTSVLTPGTLTSVFDTSEAHQYVHVQSRYIESVGVGILKVMAKMGISTLQSYKGAQIFEALGLGADIIEHCFPGTPSKISGLSFLNLGRASLEAHAQAFSTRPYTGTANNNVMTTVCHG